MKILFISTKSPLPTNDGHCLRTYNLMREIANDNDVHLLTFVKYQEEFSHLPELEEICSSVQLIKLEENESSLAHGFSLAKSVLTNSPYVSIKYNKPSMRQAIQEVLKRYDIDLVHFDMLPLYCYYDLVKGYPVVLNQHNIESALLERRVGAEPCWRRWFFLQQQKCLEGFEKLAMSSVDAIAVCSEQDRKIALKMAPEAVVDIVPNGVDTDFFKPSKALSEEPFSLVFVGGLNWYPNLEGLEWFDEEVLPHVVRDFPQLRIHLIGRQVPVNWKHKDQFIVHGFVDDIRPYLEKSSLFVVPLRIGGGTRLKILDALSMEKAVLTTTIGAEGLQLKDGQHAVFADTATDFAQKLIELCKDSHARSKLSLSARSFVDENYRWDSIGKKLYGLYERTIALNGIKSSR